MRVPMLYGVNGAFFLLPEDHALILIFFQHKVRSRADHAFNGRKLLCHKQRHLAQAFPFHQHHNIVSAAH